MKTVKLDVPQALAKRILSEFEKDISAKIRSRDELNLEISELEESAKTVRSQLQAGNGAGNRKPAGENKARIIEYLKTVGDKGARMSDIKKATGIGISSINFTLTNSEGTFVKDKKLWKLKP